MPAFTTDILDAADINAILASAAGSDALALGTTLSALVGLADPDVTAYLGTFAVPAASTHAFAISTLVKALKADRSTPGAADGTWDALDEMWLAGATSQQTTRGLKRKANLTINGTLTHTPYLGFRGDGSSGYLGTGIIPSSTAGLKYSLNSAMLGGVVNDPNTRTGNFLWGVSTSTARFRARQGGSDALPGTSMTLMVLAGSVQATTASSLPSS